MNSFTTTTTHNGHLKSLPNIIFDVGIEKIFPAEMEKL